MDIQKLTSGTRCLFGLIISLLIIFAFNNEVYAEEIGKDVGEKIIVNNFRLSPNNEKDGTIRPHDFGSFLLEFNIDVLKDTMPEDY